MYYIILDLEWNTALDKVSGKYVNEIIEVGAVKLNDKLKEVSKFSAFVSSRLTSKLAVDLKISQVYLMRICWEVNPLKR